MIEPRDGSECPKPGRSNASAGIETRSHKQVHPSEESSNPCRITTGSPRPGQRRTDNRRPSASSSDCTNATLRRPDPREPLLERDRGTRFGSARGIAGKAPTDIDDLYSARGVLDRGFFPGVRVGATRIRCGPVLTPLSSSYPGGPIPTDSLAEFTAIDSPAHGVAPETTAVTMADRS